MQPKPTGVLEGHVSAHPPTISYGKCANFIDHLGEGADHLEEAVSASLMTHAGQ